MQVFSLNCIAVTFSKFWHGARDPYEVVRGRVEFFRKIFFAPKIGKIHPKRAKTGFFEFIGKFCH